MIFEKLIPVFILLSTILGACKTQSEFGNAIIYDGYIYETDDGFYPHDNLIRSELNPQPLIVKRREDQVIIKNKIWDGYDGHQLSVTINSDLEILNIDFKEIGRDTPDTKAYTVEKAIISFNKDPFKDTLVTGYYSFQLRKDPVISESKVIPNYSVFNGKFKEYSALDLQKGLDYVRDIREINLGVKDSIGIYDIVDRYPEFLLGEAKLKKILANIEVENVRTDKGFATLQLIIKESGKVDKEKIRVLEGSLDARELDKIRKIDELFDNWLPAIYKGNYVSCRVNLPLYSNY